MGFRFRYFHLDDHLSTMKVGTDAMLLGAWSQPPADGTILDIGTGCGILAIMIAQKSRAKVDAVELDAASCQQARLNFSSSPWPVRLQLIESDFLTFSLSRKNYYDYLVCNPPFFQNALKSSSERKNRARHEISMNYRELFMHSALVLKKEGLLSTVFPAAFLNEFVQTAAESGFTPARMTAVHSKPATAVIRYLVEWSMLPQQDINETTLTIRNENGTFSDEYLSLTKDYHFFNP